MLKKMIIALGLLASTQAFADVGYHDLALRLKVERSRIDEGVRSGQLSKREAAELYAGQDNIERMIKKARKNHIVFPHERIPIELEQANQAAHISDLLNNRESAADDRYRGDDRRRWDREEERRRELAREDERRRAEERKREEERRRHAAEDWHQFYRDNFSVLQERQRGLERSIEWGARTGKLTPEESNRLYFEHQRVFRMIIKAQNDGRITRDEFYVIFDAQNALRDHIRWEKEDGQRWERDRRW